MLVHASFLHACIHGTQAWLSCMQQDFAVERELQLYYTLSQLEIFIACQLKNGARKIHASCLCPVEPNRHSPTYRGSTPDSGAKNFSHGLYYMLTGKVMEATGLKGNLGVCPAQPCMI